VLGRSQLGELLREMSAWGFKPLRVDPPGRAWTGTLQCRSAAVRVQFHVTDWDFIKYPHIRVLSGIDRSRLLPHLTIGGSFCYFREGDVVLDRHRPAISVAQCLTQAQQVLERLLFDPTFRRADLQGEFETYWLQQDPNAVPVLLGSIGKKSAHGNWCTTYWRLTKGTSSHFFLGDDADEIAKLGVAFAASARDTSVPCWLFETGVAPAIPETMPVTIKDLFDWLKAWDRAMYRRIQDVLGSSRDYLQCNAITFAVRSPAGWLGFSFDLKPIHAHFPRLAQRQPTKYRQYLHTHGESLRFWRLRIWDVSPSFVHSRNLTHPDLRNKRITVVGCGAVGSYIAQALVRLGAGTGKHSLLLIDPQDLLPENLGRHVLGYPYLFENKAKGMVRELQTSFPLARIESRAESAIDLSDLFDAHLVVDATGDDAVATALNARHVAEALNTPLLHTWILGNGEAAQALWVSGSKHACYRCLRSIDHTEQMQYRYPVLKHEPQRLQIGCHAFTPYAISAPLQAAGLVTEMVVDWLRRKNPYPRFRTRVSENADVFKVKNQDADRLKSCMACGHDSE
jgi:molybdopterin/thiamine biosynthesis adenylyltransferase